MSSSREPIDPQEAGVRGRRSAAGESASTGPGSDRGPGAAAPPGQSSSVGDDPSSPAAPATRVATDPPFVTRTARSPGWAGRPVALARRLASAAIRLPALALSRGQRTLFAEMREFARVLPGALEPPLRPAIERLTPDVGEGLPGPAAGLDEATIRRLADLAAGLAGDTGLGYCLRRSMLRYRFLRPRGLALTIHFGARLRPESGPGSNRSPDRAATGLPPAEAAGRFAAHAWLTLGGEPYHEAPENVAGYTEFLRWPPAEGGGGDEPS